MLPLDQRAGRAEGLGPRKRYLMVKLPRWRSPLLKKVKKMAERAQKLSRNPKMRRLLCELNRSILEIRGSNKIP